MPPIPMAKCRTTGHNALRTAVGNDSVTSPGSDAGSYRFLTIKAKRGSIGGGFFYSARLLSPPERTDPDPLFKTFQPKGFTSPGTLLLVSYFNENQLFYPSYLLY